MGGFRAAFNNLAQPVNTMDELPRENTFANVLQRRKMMQAYTPPIQVQPSIEEQYMQEVQNYPKYENYEPSRLRKVLGGIAGLSGVPGSQRAVTDAPYYQSLIPYEQRLGALKTGAEFGMAQDTAAARQFKARMEGQKAYQEGRKASQDAEIGIPATASMRQGFGDRARFQTTPEYGEQQANIRRAGIGPKIATFGQQGRMAVVSPEGDVSKYEVAPPNTSTVDAARIRANTARDLLKPIKVTRIINGKQHTILVNPITGQDVSDTGQSGFGMSSTQEATAYRQAIQEVLNEVDGANDYYDSNQATFIGDPNDPEYQNILDLLEEKMQERGYGEEGPETFTGGKQ